MARKVKEAFLWAVPRQFYGVDFCLLFLAADRVNIAS